MAAKPVKKSTAKASTTTMGSRTGGKITVDTKANAKRKAEFEARTQRTLNAATFIPGGAAIGAAVKGARAASATRKILEANVLARAKKGVVTKTIKATQGKKASITAQAPSGAKYSPVKGTAVKVEKKSRPQGMVASGKRIDTLVAKSKKAGRESGAKTGALMGAIGSESYEKGKRNEKKKNK